MLSRLRSIISGAPNWLYAFITSVSWLIRPNHKDVIIVPYGKYWLATDFHSKLIAPTPKTFPGRIPFAEPYERYFKVKEGDVVFDAGAEIGGFTISVARKASHVIAIEPEPINVKMLRVNVTINNLCNVDIVERGLWNRRAILDLHLSNEQGSHSLIYDWGKRDVKVQVDTLDNIVSELGIKRIDFLKMDIEGAELEALEGAKHTLDIVNKVAIAAYHVRDGQKTSQHVLRILKREGFKAFISNDFVYAWKNL